MNAVAAEVVQESMGSMILLNQTGDVKITWSEEHEASMRGLIEKKINEGYSFFIVEKKAFGLLKCKRKVKSINEISRGTELLLRDEDAVRLFSDGKINVEQNDGELVAGKSTKNVDEILKKDTIAVKPIGAG